MKIELSRIVCLLLIFSFEACHPPKKNKQKKEDSLFEENSLYAWLTEDIHFVYNKDSLTSYINQDLALLSDSVKLNYQELSNEEIEDSLKSFVKYLWDGEYNENEHQIYIQKKQNILLYGIYREVPQAFATYGGKYVDMLHTGQAYQGYKNFLYLIHSIELNSEDGLLSLASIALHFKKYKKYEELLIMSAEAGQSTAALELFGLYSEGSYSDGKQNQSLINETKASYFLDIALALNAPQAWHIKANRTVDKQEAFEYLIKSFELMNENSYRKKLYIDSYQYLSVVQTLSKRFGNRWEIYKRNHNIVD